MCMTEMIIHQKYTAKSITAPKGGAPGIVFRTAGRAKRIVTAPVTIAGASTFIEYEFDSDNKIPAMVWIKWSYKILKKIANIFMRLIANKASKYQLFCLIAHLFQTSVESEVNSCVTGNNHP